MSSAITLAVPTSVQSVTTALGQIPWTSPDNASADDGQYAECIFSPFVLEQESEALRAAYDFSQLLDSDLPFGIEVAVKRKADTSLAVADLSVQLVHAGSAIGESKPAIGSWPTLDGTLVYGAIGDTWSVGLTAAMVKAPTFGVQLRCRSLVGTGPIAFVDSILMSLHYDHEEEQGIVHAPLNDLGVFTQERMRWVSMQAGYPFPDEARTRAR